MEYTYVTLGECVYQENTSYKWDAPRYTTRKCYITILYHAIENTETCIKNELPRLRPVWGFFFPYVDNTTKLQNVLESVFECEKHTEWWRFSDDL